jgi:hypothetical protein
VLSDKVKGVVVHICNPSTQEAKARRSKVQGQSELTRTCLKKKERETEKVVLE